MFAFILSSGYWGAHEASTQVAIHLTVLAPAVQGYSRKSPGGMACWLPLCQSIRCSLSHYAPQSQTRTILHAATHTHTHTFECHVSIQNAVCINDCLRFSDYGFGAFFNNVTWKRELSPLFYRLTDVTQPHQLQWQGLLQVTNGGPRVEKPSNSICHLSRKTSLSIMCRQDTKV